jgi:hypothetical protein
MAPMLFDGTWRRLAHPRETLCDRCFYARAIARGIEITLADLRPCEFNQTWFEVFADDAPSELIAVWLRWARLNEENWNLRWGIA